MSKVFEKLEALGGHLAGEKTGKETQGHVANGDGGEGQRVPSSRDLPILGESDRTDIQGLERDRETQEVDSGQLTVDGVPRARVPYLVPGIRHLASYVPYLVSRDLDGIAHSCI